MPNWAYTSYTCESSKQDDIQDLYNKMKELEQRDESLVDNDFW